MTALYIYLDDSLNKYWQSPLDHRINFLTKKVSDIRLRIYIYLLINSTV